MRITELYLENIKGHKELKIECDYNSFGFLGSNGSGKTTILRSICLAVTRLTESDQTLANMLRLGATSGRIVLHFRLEDKPGIIDCKIQNKGKTLKRSLKWPAEKGTKAITNAVEIDTWVVNHLDCDRKSIMEAAFPAQGQLEQLLFGDRASREELLIKILNLSFCESRSRVIDGKMQALSRQMTDVGPMIDQARQRKDQAQEDMEASQKKLNEAPDHSVEITNVDNMIRLNDMLSTERSNLSQATNNAHQLEYQLKSELDRHTVSTVDNFNEMVRKDKEFVGNLETLRAELHTYQESKKYYDQLQREYTELSEKLKQTQREFEENLQPALSLDFKALETKHSNSLRYRELSKSIPDVKKRLEEHTTELSNMEPVDDEAGAKLSQEEESLQVEIQALLNHASFQKCVLKGDKEFGENNQCPDCGLKVAPDAMSLVQDPEKLKGSVETLDKLIQEKEARRDVVRKQVEQLRTQWREHNAKKNRLETAIEADQKMLKELEAELETLQHAAEIDPAAVKTEIDNARQTYHAATHTRDKVIPDLQHSMESRKLQMKSTEISLKDPPKTSKSIEDIDTELQDGRRKLTELDASGQTIANLKAKLDSAQDVVQQKTKQIETLQQDLETKQSQSQYGQFPAEALQGILLNLKNYQSERDTAQGEVNQMQKQLDREMEELKRLLKEAESNQNKAALVEELREVKAMLHKTGLPLTYAAYRFDQLLAMTGDFLSRMGARFEIAKDDEAPLAFRFRKFDDDEGGWLPMFDMSGGERVRTSVAFFLAAQQALLPQLGFMTLDEPSTHVDREGREAMVELLRDLNTSILGETRQLFLIDHDPMFKEALEGFKQLKSN